MMERFSSTEHVHAVAECVAVHHEAPTLTPCLSCAGRTSCTHEPRNVDSASLCRMCGHFLKCEHSFVGGRCTLCQAHDPAHVHVHTAHQPDPVGALEPGVWCCWTTATPSPLPVSDAPMHATALPCCESEQLLELAANPAQDEACFAQPLCACLGMPHYPPCGTVREYDYPPRGTVGEYADDESIA